MASTITDRVGSAANPLNVSTGFGITTVSNVAGTNDVTADADITSLRAGMSFYVTFVNGNTGAMRLNIQETGLIDLLSPLGAALSSGQVTAAIAYLITFDGTAYEIVSPF